MRVWILQHVSFEGPGAIAPWLEQRGAVIERCELFRGDPLPQPGSDEALVAMGGPMGVHDRQQHPWLAGELELLQRALQQDLPVLGICLGAQLMAQALGARVEPGPEREIGWWPLQVHPGADLPLADGSSVFHWHGDRFSLPPGCRPLASTAACPQQAFRRGRALGLQFHLETTPHGLDALIQHGSEELAEGGRWVQNPSGMRQDAEARCAALRGQLEQVLEAWIGDRLPRRQC